MTEPSTLNVVIGMIRDSLNASGRDDESISSDTLLFYQLAFTSMDLLDLLFRLEQHFDISVPEGTLYGLARGEMPDEEFATDGVLTPAGRDRPEGVLHDTRGGGFSPRVYSAGLPRFSTVRATAPLVDATL